MSDNDKLTGAEKAAGVAAGIAVTWFALFFLIPLMIIFIAIGCSAGRAI